jgi:hypothetical protein
VPETVWVPVRIQGGKLRVEQKRYFEEAIRQFPDCQGTLTFKRQRPSKSLEALGYLYGYLFPAIAEETGDDARSVKWDLKVLFLTVTEEHINKHTGEARFITRVRSIGELNTKEMSVFIDSIVKWAGEFLGMTLLPADKNWREREQVPA